MTSKRWWRARRFRMDSQRGAVAVEVAMIVPALVLIASVMFMLWRLGTARAQILESAEAAARAASIAVTSDQAQRVAHDVAVADLATYHITCETLQVDVDASMIGSTNPDAQIGIQMSCDLQMDPLPIPAPRAATITVETHHVIDRLKAG